MDLKFERDVVDYFNVALRNALNYLEKFNVLFNLGEIIFTPNTPNKSSRLLELINQDSMLKHNILDQLKQGFINRGYKLQDIYFVTSGTDIIIKYIDESMDTTILDMPLYSNIVSNLDEEGINNFCKTNKHFKSICNNPMFWSEMIRFKYPKYYVEKTKGTKYNWKKIYVGLYAYSRIKEEYPDKVSPYNPKKFTRLKVLLIYYSETFIYLLNNKFINLSMSDLSVLYDDASSYKHNDYISIIKSILSNNIIDNDTLKVILTSGSNLYDIELIKLLLNYEGTDSLGNKVKIDISYAKDFILHDFDHYQINLSPEQFDFYFDLLYPDGTYSDMLSLLFMGNPSDKLIEYVMDKLPNHIDTNEILDYIRESIESYIPDMTKGLWDKYKSLLSNHINLIMEIIETECDNSKDIEYMKSIFKY